MINHEFRDIEAEMKALNSIQDAAETVVLNFIAHNPEFHAICVLVNFPVRVQLRLEFWRKDASDLLEQDLKNIATYVLRVTNMKPLGELEVVTDFGTDGTACYLIRSNAKSVVRKGPRLGPQKVY